MRIHELAKELGIDSKELIKKLKALNFPVKKSLSPVTSRYRGQECFEWRLYLLSYH